MWSHFGTDHADWSSRVGGFVEWVGETLPTPNGGIIYHLPSNTTSVELSFSSPLIVSSTRSSALVSVTEHYSLLLSL